MLASSKVVRPLAVLTQGSQSAHRAAGCRALESAREHGDLERAVVDDGQHAADLRAERR